MNRSELQHILDQEGFDRTAYSLYGEKGYDIFCLAQAPLTRYWEMYFLERGKKLVHGTYRNEDEACRAFLGWIRQYPELKLGHD